MATLVSDNFDRADNTDIGVSWKEFAGTWDIATNLLKLTTFSSTNQNGDSNDDCIYLPSVGASPPADYDVEAVINLGTTGNAGVFGRRLDKSNMYYILVSTVTQTIYLRKLLGNVITTFGTFAGGYSISTNYTIKLTQAGTSLAAIEGGISRVSTTDSALTQAGKCGCQGGTSNQTYNNFAVYGTSSPDSPIVKPNILRPRVFAPGRAR